MDDYTISVENIDSNDANSLIDELSEQLMKITGNSGKSSFDNSDMNNPRSVFVIARKENKAVGCGAFRELSEDVAEIKRMYTREKSHGIGSEILRYLEVQAKELGYKKNVLETRKCNERAVTFYLNNGYMVTNNYGKYKGNIEAICFEKIL